MSRNIYFCGSIRAGRGDADLYVRIVKKLETYGKVLAFSQCWTWNLNLGKILSQLPLNLVS